MFLKLARNRQSGKAFLMTSNFVLKELSASALGIYTCIKSLKNVYKKTSEIFFFTLARNGQSDKALLLTSKFCPQRVVCPYTEAMYMNKIIKNVYKIRFQRDSFKTCNK